MTRNYFPPIVAAICFGFLGWNLPSILAGTITVYYITNLIVNLGNYIAFREFLMVLFSVNFLLSPAMILNGLEKYQYYPMYLSESDYFLCAIPAILLMHAGVYMIKTKLFEINFSLVTGAV